MRIAPATCQSRPRDLDLTCFCAFRYIPVSVPFKFNGKSSPFRRRHCIDVLCNDSCGVQKSCDFAVFAELLNTHVLLYSSAKLQSPFTREVVLFLARHILLILVCSLLTFALPAVQAAVLSGIPAAQAAISARFPPAGRESVRFMAQPTRILPADGTPFSGLRQGLALMGVCFFINFCNIYGCFTFWFYFVKKPFVKHPFLFEFLI